MAQTYTAILKGDRLEWTGEAPGPATPDGGVAVRVTILEEPPGPGSVESRKRLMLQALENLAAANPFREIDDPVAWQREVRRDRSLPGREP